MMQISTIIGKTIVKMLSANAAVRAMVGDRIYMDMAPGTAPRPYIIFAWASGGYDNSASGNAFDVMYTVAGVSNDASQSRQLGEYINTTLKDQVPDFPVGVEYNSVITAVDIFHDSMNVQNEFFWRDGMVYRFRGMDR